MVTLPPNYKPSKKEEYMNEMQLEYFKRKLLDWRAELMKGSASTLQDLKDNNINEADETDRASNETDQSLELRTRDRMRKLIKKINQALDRIENGTYGYCEETGEPIGLARLEARPVATLSIEAQERHERKEKTFAEE
ncbi:MAG: RNA polymerase-binding protein DksA [Alphaproteobacteria bacterium]|nr:RNA polymerase-binding protein DksA [Alphaproteobacteria bacterium]